MCWDRIIIIGLWYCLTVLAADARIASVALVQEVALWGGVEQTIKLVPGSGGRGNRFVRGFGNRR